MNNERTDVEITVRVGVAAARAAKVFAVLAPVLFLIAVILVIWAALGGPRPVLMVIAVIAALAGVVAVRAVYACEDIRLGSAGRLVEYVTGRRDSPL